MEKELLEAIQKQTKLAGEVMEQAATLRMTVESLEARNKEMDTELDSLRRAQYNNAHLMQGRLLSQWGLRVRYAHSMNLLFSALVREGKEKMYTFDGKGPFKSVSDTKQELLSAGEWVLIWYEVEKRVKKRYEMFKASIERIRNKEPKSTDGR